MHFVLLYMQFSENANEMWGHCAPTIPSYWWRKI